MSLWTATPLVSCEVWGLNAFFTKKESFEIIHEQSRGVAFAKLDDKICLIAAALQKNICKFI
jgi:hypothetical protein